MCIFCHFHFLPHQEVIHRAGYVPCDWGSCILKCGLLLVISPTVRLYVTLMLGRSWAGWAGVAGTISVACVASLVVTQPLVPFPQTPNARAYHGVPAAPKPEHFKSGMVPPGQLSSCSINISWVPPLTGGGILHHLSSVLHNLGVKGEQVSFSLFHR